MDTATATPVRDADVAQGAAGRTVRRRWRPWVWLAVVIVAGFGLWEVLPRPLPVPENAVLVVDLRAELARRPAGDLERFLGSPTLDSLRLGEALARAAGDRRVRGILVKLGRRRVGFATAQELGAALESLRRAGKAVFAQVSGPNGTNYLLAIAADEVILDASSSFDVTGVSLTAWFLGDALERYGVEADLVRVGKYKGAFEQLTAARSSPAFAESMRALVDSLHTTLVAEIARSRSLEEAVVRDLLDRAPLSGAEALAAGLVDAVAFPSATRERITSRLGVEPALLAVEDYWRSIRSERGGGRHIAVVPVLGAIVEGASGSSSVLGEVSGDETIASAIERAVECDDVAAIVLRIDSPGGQVAASERLWKLVELARRKKPVVASFGDVAASGGYYVACGADVVFAEPSTLTGSIGVFGGKLVIEDFLAEHRVGCESFHRGRAAGMFDPTRRFTPEERLRLEELITSAYERFVRRVSLVRAIDDADVRAAAQGRVWTGAQARRLGLVDRLGGLSDAAREAARLARLEFEGSPELRAYPPPATIWDLLQRRTPLVQGAAEPVGAMGQAARALQWCERIGLHGSTSGVALWPCALEVR